MECRVLRVRGDSVQQLANLLVAGLLKIRIPRANSHKRLRGCAANYLVDFAAQIRTSFGSCHRHRNDDLRRLHVAQRGSSGAHCRSGCQPVIDENHRAPLYTGARPIFTVQPFAAFQLLLLAQSFLSEEPRTVFTSELRRTTQAKWSATFSSSAARLLRQTVRCGVWNPAQMVARFAD